MKTLNYVQKRLADAFERQIFRGSTDRGILCAPTGTGKTGTARAIINLYANKMHAGGSVSGYSVFLTPRIGLTNQQGDALQHFHIADEKYSDCPIMVHYIHSDSPDEVSKSEILNSIERAKANKIYLVFCSTYHSAHRLEKIDPDLIICDEAHNLVGRKEKNLFMQVVMDGMSKTARRVFMTATPKEVNGENSLGFNNTELFGEYIGRIAPRIAIQKNIIIPPRLHICQVSSDKTESQTLVSQVIHSFNFHNGYNRLIPAKVLMNLKGTASAAVIRKNWQKIKENTGADVCTIVSNSAGGRELAFINGDRVSREALFDHFNNSDSGAILGHVRIVSEGISIPSLTGVVFMDPKEMIPAVQTVGRALRVHDADRDEMGYGKPMADRIKKAALVTLMVYNGDTTVKKEISKWIGGMRTAGFDLFTETVIYSDTDSDKVDNTAAAGQMRQPPQRKKKDYNQVELTEVISDLEKEEKIQVFSEMMTAGFEFYK